MDQTKVRGSGLAWSKGMQHVFYVKITPAELRAPRTSVLPDNNWISKSNYIWILRQELDIGQPAALYKSVQQRLEAQFPRKMALNSHFLIKLNFFPNLDSGCSLILVNPGREKQNNITFFPTQTVTYYKTTDRFASTAVLIVFLFVFVYIYLSTKYCTTSAITKSVNLDKNY